MQCVRLFEDATGVSRFEDVEIEMDASLFAPPAPSMPVSVPEPCSNLRFLVLPAGWGGAQHPSPRRQVGLLLSGRVRVEAGSGEVREFGPGAIWRMEDVTGAGHTTTVLGAEDVAMAIVQLA